MQANQLKQAEQIKQAKQSREAKKSKQENKQGKQIKQPTNQERSLIDTDIDLFGKCHDHSGYINRYISECMHKKNPWILNIHDVHI